ncbi:Uncharacterized protein Fot_10243 [Forsythia ovata]|uniref:Uncharacterized protein n=1 Tax=Forsythia ovata TaxID=205694 RepID=A0ABD1WG98_9LAMI
MKRKCQVVMTCSECGLQGHNKRYHLRPGAPGNDWFDAQLDPMESDMQSPLDSRKKEIDISPMVEDLERLNAEEAAITRAARVHAKSQINTRSSRFVPPRAR